MLFAKVYEQQTLRKLCKSSTKLWGLGHAM